MSIDFSQHWAAGGPSAPRQGAERAEVRETESRTGADRTAADRTAAESFGFGDFLDIVNPMHHLPVVGTVYRDLTGDEIKPVSRVLGAGVFGGPIGLAGGVASAMIEETTGNDPMGHLYSAVTGRGPDQDASQADAQSTSLSAPQMAEATGESPARHWSAGQTATDDQVAHSGNDGSGDPRAHHWAGRTAPADQESEQHAAAIDQSPTAQASREAGQETVTFFPLGPSGSGPRTTTINRPEAPAPSVERERPAGDSRNSAAVGPGLNAATAMPAPAQGSGRMNDETEAVMRAMSMGLGAIGREAGDPDASNQGSRDQGSRDHENGTRTATPNAEAGPASEAQPSNEATPPTPAPSPATSQEDIASAMGRALDQYQTMDHGEAPNSSP